MKSKDIVTKCMDFFFFFFLREMYMELSGKKGSMYPGPKLVGTEAVMSDQLD